MTTETFVKDIKPGLKNLNLIFIVLETGGYAGAGHPLWGFSGLGGITSILNLLPGWQGAPQNMAHAQSFSLTPAQGVALKCRVHATLARSKPPVSQRPLSTQHPLHGAGSSTPHPPPQPAPEI